MTSPVYAGEDFSVSATVQNQGTLATSQVAALGIYIDHSPTGPGDPAFDADMEAFDRFGENAGEAIVGGHRERERAPAALPSGRGGGLR